MARVLLVDTNVSSLPIYEYLCTTGNEIYLIGNNPNDALAKYVNNYIQADYSNLETLRATIKQLNIEFIVPGCNDASYKACALVNDTASFPGIESSENSEILNNKQKFRVFSEQHGLPVPRIYNQKQVDASSYPLIVKPVDSFSGRGVTVIFRESREALDVAISKAQKQSKDGSCVIEEYVQGQLYSHSAFIAGGEIIADVIVEEHCVAYPFAVDTSRVVANASDRMLKNIREAVVKISKKLSLKDGLIHTQFISNGSSIWLIEPTRRCPGDLYSRLVDMSTNLNYAENYTRAFLGMPFNFTAFNFLKSLIIRHTFTDREGGFFITMSFPKAIKVREFVPLSLAGDKILPAPGGRAGLLFIETDTIEEQESILTKAVTRKLYDPIQI